MTYMNQSMKLVEILTNPNMDQKDKLNYLETFNHTKKKWKKSWNAIGLDSTSVEIIRKYEKVLNLKKKLGSVRIR